MAHTEFIFHTTFEERWCPVHRNHIEAEWPVYCTPSC